MTSLVTLLAVTLAAAVPTGAPAAAPPSVEWHVWGTLAETGERVDLVSDPRVREPLGRELLELSGELRIEVVLPAGHELREVRFEANVKEQSYRKRIKRWRPTRSGRVETLTWRTPFGAAMYFELSCSEDACPVETVGPVHVAPAR